MMDTIGFLGCGNMGGAIARAVCKAVDPKKVFWQTALRPRHRHWPKNWAAKQPPMLRWPVTAT